jgi:hypothetical protein
MGDGEDMPGLNKIPRSAGGEWEFVRDSREMVRYRRSGDLAWTFLSPVKVAEFNQINLP